MTNYPASIDTSLSLPAVVDNLTPVTGSAVNRLRDAILSIEGELGVHPATDYGTIRARLDFLETSIGNTHGVELAGDLGNTLSIPYVIGMWGRPISSAVPSLNDALIWNGIAWAPHSSITGGAAGGDLNGFYPNPTVIQIQGHPVQSSSLGPSEHGYVLTWNNTAGELEFLPVAGTLDLFGDLSGTTAAATVTKWLGNSLDPTTMGSPPDGYVPIWHSGSSSWKASPNIISSSAVSPGSIGQTFITDSALTSTWDSTLLVTPGTNLQISYLSGSGNGYISLDASGNLSRVSTIPTGGIAPGTSGQIFITNGTPAADWTSLISVDVSHGLFTAGGSGTDYSAAIGPRPSHPDQDAMLWLMVNGSTPNDTNWTLDFDGTKLNINSPGNLLFSTGATTVLASIESTHGKFTSGGSGTDTSVTIGPYIGSESSYSALYMTPNGSSASASSLVFFRGGGTVGINAPGSDTIYLQGSNLAYFVNGGVVKAQVEFTHGKITAGGGGSDTLATIGPLTGFETTDVALWLLQNGVARTSGNYAIEANSANLYLQAPSTAIYFNIGGAGSASLTTSVLTLTAPSIQFNTGVSAAVIGTNAASATLTLQADAAANVIQFAGGTQSGVPLGANMASGGHIRTPNNFIWNGRNAANSADFSIFYLDSSNQLTFGDLSLAANLIRGTSNYLDSGNLYFRDTGPATVIHWTLASTGASSATVSEGVTSFNLGYMARSSDLATYNLTIQGQYAFATATGTNRTPGNLIFDIGAPTNGGTTVAQFVWTQNASPLLYVDYFSSATNLYSAAGAPFNIFATPSKTSQITLDTTYFATGGTAWWLSANANGVGFNSSSPSAASPFRVDYSAPTTPLLQSGTSATSLTLGTNLAAATLTLQADAAASVIQFAGGSQAGYTLGSNLALAGHFRTTETWTWYSRNAANSANYRILNFSGDALYFGDNQVASLSFAANGTLTLASSTTYAQIASSALYLATTGGLSTIQATADGTWSTIYFIQTAKGTVGTNNASAVLSLAAGAGSEIVQFADGTQGGIALGSHLASAGHVRFTESFMWMSRNDLNTGDRTLLKLDGSDNLYYGLDYATLQFGSTSVSTAGMFAASYIFLESALLYLDGSTQNLRDTAHGLAAIWTLNSAGSTSLLTAAGVTDFTVGTNKVGANLFLSGDANIKSIGFQLSSSTVNEIDFFSPNGTAQAKLTVSDAAAILLSCPSGYLDFAATAAQAELQLNSTTQLFTNTANFLNWAGTTKFLRWSNGALTVTLGDTTLTNILDGALQETTRASSSSFTLDTTTTDRHIFVTATQTITLDASAHANGRRTTFWVDTTSTGSNGSDITLTIAPASTEKINGTNANWAITVPGSPQQVQRLEMIGDGTNLRVD